MEYRYRDALEHAANGEERRRAFDLIADDPQYDDVWTEIEAEDGDGLAAYQADPFKRRDAHLPVTVEAAAELFERVKSGGAVTVPATAARRGRKTGARK